MATIMVISEKELKKGAKAKVVKNPYLDEIVKLVKSKKLQGLDLTKGPYNQLSVGLEIDWNPKDLKSWMLSFLFVPDLKKHDHFHIDVDMKTAKKLHKYLTDLLQEAEKRTKKPKKRK